MQPIEAVLATAIAGDAPQLLAVQHSKRHCPPWQRGYLVLTILAYSQEAPISSSDRHLTHGLIRVPNAGLPSLSLLLSLRAVGPNWCTLFIVHVILEF